MPSITSVITSLAGKEMTLSFTVGDFLGVCVANANCGNSIRPEKTDASQSNASRQRILMSCNIRSVASLKLKDDSRPTAERAAAGRYSDPTLFALATAHREIADSVSHLTRGRRPGATEDRPLDAKT